MIPAAAKKSTANRLSIQILAAPHESSQFDRPQIRPRIVASWRRHEAAEPDISTERLMERVRGDTGADIDRQIEALERARYVAGTAMTRVCWAAIGLAVAGTRSIGPVGSASNSASAEWRSDEDHA
jgi:hypothetical protein